jgi:hypothetical protein
MDKVLLIYIVYHIKRVLRNIINVLRVILRRDCKNVNVSKFIFVVRNVGIRIRIILKYVRI